MAKSSGKATSLRSFLIFVMLLVIAGAAAGVYFGLEYTRGVAEETNKKLIDAEASSARIEQLRELQTELAESNALIEKAESVYATNTSYQSQAIRDLQRYADVAGVSIDDINFPAADPAAPTPDRTVEVTLDSPVSYARLIRFIQLTEGNVPLMQVTSLTVGRPENPSGDAVTVSELTLRVAVR